MGITETDFKRIQSNSHEPQISLRRQIFTHWIKKQRLQKIATSQNLFTNQNPPRSKLGTEAKTPVKHTNKRGTFMKRMTLIAWRLKSILINI